VGGKRVFIFNRYIEAIGYKKLKLPGQKYIQHREVKYPNHIGHLGQTITNHTWVLHEEPLEHDQNSLCYQEFQLMVTVHRADKIFLTQPKNENRTRSLMIGNEHIKSFYHHFPQLFGKQYWRTIHPSVYNETEHK
jgi:hypothetical protein